jgi:adhesin/invasin
MNYRAVAFLLLLVSLLPVAGCDKATPVAPNGTILTISANPSQVSLNGKSTITVVGRKPDGNPLNTGTEIRLSVDKGTITPSVIEVDRDGSGTATFRADGRLGVAKVTAATGGGDAKAEADIQIGQPTDQKPTVTVNVNPTTIPINGHATVTVIGQNSDGSPATGQRVILTSTLGTLGSGSLTLGSDGTATTTLTAGTQSGMAKVTAVLGAASQSVDVTIRDRTLVLQVSPASIRRPANDTDPDALVTLTARVTDFQGNAVEGVAVTFQTTRGFLVPTGVVNTDKNGTATTTLHIRKADLNATDASFQVTASIPSGNGDPISQTATITVTG